MNGGSGDGDCDSDGDGSGSEISIPDLSRLPKDVVPKRYEVKLEVDPQKKAYKGTVNIRLYFHGPEATSIVWLHAGKNVRVESVHVWFSQFLERPIQTAEVIRVPEKECIGVRLVTPVKKGDRAWLGQGYFVTDVPITVVKFFARLRSLGVGCTTLIHGVPAQGG